MSPIPGREGGAVLGKLRTWAAQVGEIKLTDDANPVISLQITGVDVEPLDDIHPGMVPDQQADLGGAERHAEAAPHMGVGLPQHPPGIAVADPVEVLNRLISMRSNVS